MSTGEAWNAKLRPTGDESWRGYSLPKVTRQVHTHTRCFQEIVKPVFQGLSNDSLLSQCCLENLKTQMNL